MTHRLTTNYAKNYCNRTLIVKVIVENVVTFFGGHGVDTAYDQRRRHHCLSVVHRTRLSIVGDRAFPIAAARTWNALSHHVVCHD